MTTAVDALSPIGLPELLARAELLTRVDRKYLLDAATADLLIDLLPDGAAVLEIDGERQFGYTSTYLDTADLTSFHQGAHRRRRRFKVRVRRYAGGAAYLEVKTRRGRATVKERLEGDHLQRAPLRAGRSCAAADSVGLTPAGQGFVAQVLAAAGIDPDVVGDLRPVLTTSYRRSTILPADQATRLTLDQGLAWSHVDGSCRRSPGMVILETKSATGASSADRLLWSLGHRPQRFSKYATGLAALHPTLPHNRWHRSLRHLHPHSKD